jgi:hypothetical protein
MEAASLNTEQVSLHECSRAVVDTAQALSIVLFCCFILCLISLAPVHYQVRPDFPYDRFPGLTKLYV